MVIERIFLQSEAGMKKRYPSIFLTLLSVSLYASDKRHNLPSFPHASFDLKAEGIQQPFIFTNQVRVVDQSTGEVFYTEDRQRNYSLKSLCGFEVVRNEVERQRGKVEDEQYLLLHLESCLIAHALKTSSTIQQRLKGEGEKVFTSLSEREKEREDENSFVQRVLSKIPSVEVCVGKDAETHFLYIKTGIRLAHEMAPPTKKGEGCGYLFPHQENVLAPLLGALREDREYRRLSAIDLD